MEESFTQKKADDGSSTPSTSSDRASAREIVVYAVVALGIALFIRTFIASPWLVSGTSMLPNFQNNNYLLVDRLSYRFGNPKRGDVIVFGLPQMLSRDLIKRVIGLPGETVSVNNNHVTIVNAAHPKGFVLKEPYLDPADLGGFQESAVTLGTDEYFVLGDNRAVSADSRIWGTLPRQDIIGKVFLRLFPFQEIGVLPAQVRYAEDTSK